MSDLEQPTQVTFESWALVELMGRQRIVGKAKEETHFGTALLRVDVPAQGDEAAYTKFFGGSAIYCITPITEDMAKRMLVNVRPDPVPMWELRPQVEMLPAHDYGDAFRPGDSDDEEDPSDFDPDDEDEE
ncbi:MAG TPA: hypothetical protein PL187_03990 [Caldilinea sp.]|nr:hypothetical protein [Caldilinea sp.]